MDHTICYLSKQDVNLREDALEEMFQFILDMNSKLGITGALLHNNNFFLQVLEGKKDTISNLFQSIKKDTRHHNILTIFDQPIASRVFENYEAKFSILKTKSDISNLNSYLSLYDLKNKYPQNIKSLIAPFLI